MHRMEILTAIKRTKEKLLRYIFPIRGITWALVVDNRRMIQKEYKGWPEVGLF